jgi:hypothetical protein
VSCLIWLFWVGYVGDVAAEVRGFAGSHSSSAWLLNSAGAAARVGTRWGRFSKLGGAWNALAVAEDDSANGSALFVTIACWPFAVTARTETDKTETALRIAKAAKERLNVEHLN